MQHVTFRATTLIALLISVAFAPRAAATTVAIINSRGSGHVPAEIEDLLAVSLSSQPNVQLVERTLIKKVLDEQALGATGLFDASSAAKMGQLVAADIVALIEQAAPPQPAAKAPAAKPAAAEADPAVPTLRVRLVETRSGALLDDVVIAHADIAAPPNALTEALSNAVSKVVIEPAKRHYVGILSVRSEEPGRTLDALIASWTMILPKDLRHVADVVVLEREQLDRLTREKDLTGLELQLKASTTLLQAGLRRDSSGNQLDVALSFNSLGSGKSQSVPVKVPGKDLASVRSAVMRAVSGQLGAAQVAESSPDDLRREARIFAAQAVALASYHRQEEGMACAETALALEPVPTHRTLAYSLANGLMRSSRLPLPVRLRYGIRAHEIDITLIDELGHTPGSSLRPYADRYRLFGRYDEHGNVGDIFHPTARTAAHPDPESPALFEELNNVCLQEYDLLSRLCRERQDPVYAAVLVARLDHAARLAKSAQEYMDVVKTQVSAFDAEVAAGRATRTDGTYYMALKRGIASPDDKFAGAPESIQPLLDWLSQHPDPFTRAAGWYGMTFYRDQRGEHAAEQLFDLFFKDIPPDAVLPRDPFWSWEFTERAASAAAVRLRTTGQLEGRLSALLDDLEARNDLTPLVCRPSCSVFFIAPGSNDDLRRVRDLLDRIPASASYSKDAASLRRSMVNLLETRTGETENDSGPWNSYKITPVEVPPPAPEFKFVRGACPTPQGLVLLWVSRSYIPLAAAPTPAAAPPGASTPPTRTGRATRATPSAAAARAAARIPAGAATECALALYPITGGPCKQFARFHVDEVPYMRDCCYLDGKVYMTTSNAGLIVGNTQAAEVFDDQRGAPGNDLRALGALEGKIYFGGDGCVAAFDPQSRKFEILASARAVEGKGPLDGGTNYIVDALLPDPARHCLWLTVRPVSAHLLNYSDTVRKSTTADSARSGIWKYTPGTGAWEHVARSEDVQDLYWVQDKMFGFNAGGSGSWQQFDPATGQMTKKTGGFTAIDTGAYFDNGRPHAILSLGERLIEYRWLLRDPGGKNYRRTPDPGQANLLFPHENGFLAILYYTGHPRQPGDRINGTGATVIDVQPNAP